MANVRLTRQSLEDYNARVTRIDRQYRSDYDRYIANVGAYNADVRAHPYDEAQTRSVGGEPQYLMSTGPDTQVQSTDELGRPVVDVMGTPVMETKPGEKVYASRPTSLPTPVAPAQAVAPRAPNLTNNDYRAMRDPGTDQAGVAKANALGYTGKSELAGDAGGAMRNSAFADPADPNGLKDRGILARVMGGQL